MFKLARIYQLKVNLSMEPRSLESGETNCHLTYFLCMDGWHVCILILDYLICPFDSIARQLPLKSRLELAVVAKNLGMFLPDANSVCVRGSVVASELIVRAGAQERARSSVCTTIIGPYRQK